MAGTERIDPGGGLVEDEEAGGLDEGLGQSDTLQHPLGIPCKTAVSGFGEGGEFEEFFDAVLETLRLSSRTVFRKT